jgi:5-methylcytosine-specific restriction endonuclease McrA
MPEHGTRTMYVHYGCRCEACCQAEHNQYLKRSASKVKVRVNSKWGEQVTPITTRGERQKLHNKQRYKEYLTSTVYRKRIRWQDVVLINGTKCAICGIETDPFDVWVNDKGRKCFGRKYPTVDHIISLRNGGKDTFDNVQLLCKHCNSAKGRN